MAETERSLDVVRSIIVVVVVIIIIIIIIIIPVAMTDVCIRRHPTFHSPPLGSAALLHREGTRAF